jgi:lipopolysaccharide/colanic/teichoic acid biosynthesis glycosyltransferase
VDLRPDADAPKAGAREPRAERRHLMNEEVFRSVLVRERKRSDRSNQPFIVLLLSRDLVAGAEATSWWEGAIDALMSAKRETDVLGWFERGTTIGLVVPDIKSTTTSIVAGELENRVRTELGKRLDGPAASGCALQLHVHDAQKETAGDERLWPVEPLLEKAAPRNPRARLHERFKRALDIAGSLALLTMLLPAFLLIAVLVKLKSPGPVFFRQKRIGAKAQPFTMLKFRSMHLNADNAIHQQYVNWFITASDQEKKSAVGVFKLTNDPRITPIGNFLRKSSLDELPQLWNVLRGDMSLVGPRPPLEYEVQKYAPWHCRRVLEAKPGITGLWQVTGRSRTTFDEMVRLVLRYARKVSIWTDIKILLATPRAVIMGKGAC